MTDVATAILTQRMQCTVKECWVNVYEIEGRHEIGYKYSRDKAIEKAAYVLNTFGTPCLYRIHVRLK